MQFYLSNQADPLDRNHALWNRSLPVSRTGGLAPDAGLEKRVLTYGEYFSAVDTFVRTCPQYFSDVNDPSFENVAVRLEKHGAFYHPSRISVSSGNRADDYVLNLAFSNTGREFLKNEYQILKRLEKKYGYPFLPKMFAFQELDVDASRSVNMFMGEWFGSYHEFHVSMNQKKGPGRVRVWDPCDEACFLSREQAGRVYAQAARLLTACYDIETFEHISSWHHAAGDFVVNLGNPEAPRVKLVTVRRYGPLLERVDPTAEAILNGLLLFLLNLSIHMRLDRLDGVHDICWLDDFIVEASLTGFYQGLELHVQAHRIPDDFPEHFKSFMADISMEAVRGLFAAVADRLPGGSPDTTAVRSNIEKHAEAFHRSLRSNR